MSLKTLTIICLMAIVLANVTAAATNPPELDGCKVFKVWNFDKEAEGWEADHNVGKLTVKDGILSFEDTGVDPWIVQHQTGNPKASEYTYIGIKMRSSAPGTNEVFFGTPENPGAGAGRSVSKGIINDGKYHFYQFNMSKLKQWAGNIDLIRIDTANGGSEIGAKIEIDWIAIYKPPARVSIGRPEYICGENKSVVIPLENTGSEDAAVEIGDASDENVAKQSLQLKPNQKETSKITLDNSASKAKILVKQDGSTIIDADIICPDKEQSEPPAVLENKTARLKVWKNQAELLIKSGDKEISMGKFGPLAVLALRDNSGVLHYMELSADKVEPDNSGHIQMQTKKAISDGNITVKWIITLFKDSDEGTIECSLRSNAPLDILRFECPRLLAGEGSFGTAKTHAIFPGIEYLEKDESSGNFDYVGPWFADRHIPHPYKVTVPVMAVETESGVVGISWDPLTEWAQGQKLPCAEFESPNRVEDAKNHLMTVFAPSIPDYMSENSELAENAFTLKPSFDLKLKVGFFAKGGKKITDVIPDYYAEHGYIKPSLLARGINETIDLCIKAYTDALYQPDKKGWKSNIGSRQTSSFNNAYAATILAESLRKGDPEIAKKCGIDPNSQLTTYTGTTLDWFASEATKGVDGLIKTQMDDGGFGYKINDAKRKEIKGTLKPYGMDYDALGEVGKVYSGIQAQSAYEILNVALRTGKEKYLKAGLKALDKLNTISVPRGAQTWEVNAYSPDILASARATLANLYGYELTGDLKYIEKAKFWAYTGLPFIYSWAPPIDPVPSSIFHFDGFGEGTGQMLSSPSDFYTDTKKSVNPGGTIAVFGATVYTIPWYGKPVQWCGMHWANTVWKLLDLQPDLSLQSAAKAVFSSCLQQQFDKGSFAGTYPDSWNLMENSASTAFVSPDLILDFAYMMIGEKQPSKMDARGFDLLGKRALLNTYGMIEQFQADVNKVNALIKYYEGQDLYISIIHVPRPAKVEMEMMDVAEATDLKKVESGYSYDTDNQILNIKYRPIARSSAMNITW